jgi:putative hydrolase of the HAD superfamily
MDGVLALTEPLKADAHVRTVKSLGGNARVDMYSKVMGQSFEKVRAFFSKNARIDTSPETYTQIFDQIYQVLLRTRLELTPGIMGLIHLLIAKGYLLAVVSSSPSETMDDILDGTGLSQYFDVRVSAEDVSREKPAPDSYLLALDLLNLSPTSVVVIEDSEPGIESAVGAGTKVIALRHAFNISQDFSKAHAILNSLRDIHAVTTIVDDLLRQVGS